MIRRRILSGGCESYVVVTVVDVVAHIRVEVHSVGLPVVGSFFVRPPARAFAGVMVRHGLISFGALLFFVEFARV